MNNDLILIIQSSDYYTSTVHPHDYNSHYTIAFPYSKKGHANVHQAMHIENWLFQLYQCVHQPPLFHWLGEL